MELNRISDTRSLPGTNAVRGEKPSLTKEAGPSDGFQRGAQEILLGKPLFATAVPERVAFPAVDENGFQTLLITATPDERGRTELPYEAAEALESLAKATGDQLKLLPTTDGPANLFATEHVVRVHESKLDALKEAMAPYPTLKAANMAEVLNAEPGTGRFEEDLVKSLDSGDLAAQARTSSTLARLFASKNPPNLDLQTRNSLADGAFKTVHGLVNLFNATILNETAGRRTELIEERRKADKEQTVGEVLGGFFNASEVARDELRAKGGTPAINRLGVQVVEAFDLLGALDTKRANAFRTQLLSHADGALLKEVVADPAQAEKMMDTLVDVVSDRMEQTKKYNALPEDQRPEKVRGTRSSGGYSNLAGSQQNLSMYEWSADYPYSDAPTSALVLLGTEQAGMVRDKLKSVFLKADADLPQIQADYRQNEVGEKIASSRKSLTAQTASWPAAQREEALSQLLESEQERIEKDFEPLNSQGDVRHLAESLSWINHSNEEVFSDQKAQTETALFLADLLPQLKTPDMHRLLTDTALNVWDRSDKASPEAKAALLQAIVAPGADEEARLGAATRLMTQGETSLVPTVIEALSHPNSEVRHTAISALGVATAVTHDRKVGNADGLVKALELPTARVQFQARLSPAMGQLEKLLADPDSIWIRTDAAKVLADLGSDSPAAIAALLSLLADDGATVNYGAGNPSRKNATARTHAADTLAFFGARAGAAIPDLQAQVKAADQAKAALAVIDARREELKGQQFESQDDPACREAMTAALKAGGGNSFQRALTFLEDPKSPKTAEIPSYSRDNYPLAETALREAISVGDAARRALAKIKP